MSLDCYPEIMTIEEVAEYLRMPEQTILDWSDKGILPSGKMGSTWRYRRDDIAQWVKQQLPSDRKQPAAAITDLRDVVVREQVMVTEFRNKADALNSMIDSLARTPFVKDRAALAEGIFHRERLMSTGIGMQIGVPHVRLPVISDVAMAVAMNRCAIEDYESLDNQPVRLLFMIVAREDQHAHHLRILASIGSRLKDVTFRNSLLEATDASVLYNLLKAE